MEFGKFSVLGRAAFVVVGGTSKLFGSDLKTTGFGLNVTPVLMYNLSNHFALLADLNFLNLTFAQSSSKRDNEKQGSDTTFTFGVDSSNIAQLGSDSGLMIGFAYKF